MLRLRWGTTIGATAVLASAVIAGPACGEKGEGMTNIGDIDCPEGSTRAPVPTRDASGNPLSPPPLVDEGTGYACARADGTFHGGQRGFFRDGEPEHAGEWREGKRSGRWTWWDRQGQKVTEGEYVDGEKSGVWTEWRGGKKTSEGAYAAGKQVGEWTRWYDTTGQKQSVNSYADGQAIGRSSRWHLDGKLAEEGSFEAGKRSGRWYATYPSGQKMWEGDYRADKQEGRWTWWNADGSVERTAEFVNGVEQGQ
jgi:antitoxin component YwqK of YwqJK toxin-antitoxin module